MKLVYLHGFNSSPQSYKARQLKKYVEKHVSVKGGNPGDYLAIPEIPPAPSEAIKLLREYIEKTLNVTRVSLIGSSLGGYYATWLAEQFDCKAVLINPAVKPYKLLKNYLGENVNFYTSESWKLEDRHIDELKRLEVDITSPERYMLMVQTGDETLDYRMAVDKYKKCRKIIEEGGNHSFNTFDAHLPTILDFCGFH